MGLGPELSRGHEAIPSFSPCCLSLSELHMRVHRCVEIKGFYFPFVPQSVNYLYIQKQPTIKTHWTKKKKEKK